MYLGSGLGGFRTAGSIWWGCAEGEEHGAFIAAGFGLCPLALSPPGTVTPWHCHPLALSLLVLRIHHQVFWLWFWGGWGRALTKPPDPWRARRGCSTNHPAKRAGVSDICFVSARRSGAGRGPTRWTRLKRYRAWPDNKRSLFIYDGWTLSRSLARSPRAMRSNPSLDFPSSPLSRLPSILCACSPGRSGLGTNSSPSLWLLVARLNKFRREKYIWKWC